MRMLIAGGGDAGLTLANFLHRYGFEPVVIEQAACAARRLYRPAKVAVWRRQSLAEAGVAPLQVCGF